jgi:hypothetical protein
VRRSACEEAVNMEMIAIIVAVAKSRLWQAVIASEAKQSTSQLAAPWIASSLRSSQ